MEQRFFFRPALAFLIPLILGIAAGTWFSGHILLPVAAILASSAYLIHSATLKRTLLTTPLIFFLSLGYISVQPWTSPSIPDRHISNYAEPFRWEITGTVSNDPMVIQNNRVRFVMEVESLQKEQENPFPAVGRLRVTCMELSSPEFQPGDRIRFPGKIRPVRNFNNPGGFDYERFMSFKTIHNTTWVAYDKIIPLEKNQNQNMMQRVTNARKTIATVIDDTHSNESSAAIMKALVIGDRTGIHRDLRQAFNKAGMGHLLAISGLHVGIVASFFFLLFSRIFSLNRIFLDHAWVGKASALLCIVPVTMYGLLSGMSPSTQRAVIMINVFLLTFLIKRQQNSINTLAIAAMTILVIYPPALFSISFQLSFTAVFSILFGLSRIGYSRTKFETQWIIREKISAFFFVSLFAILGTLPLVMYYFNQASLVGLFANFILVPLIGFLVVPLGLVSAFVFPVSQTISSIGFQVGGSVLSFALNIVHFFANLPFSSVKTITPSFLEITLYYLLAGALLYFGTQKRLETRESSAVEKPTSLISQTLGRKAPVIIISTLVLFWIADISYWVYARFLHPDLRITIVDVGQGNAAIVQFPGRKVMMIDGGGFYDNNAFDVGEKIVAPLLSRNKIRTVNSLILTHPHSDHLNGFLYIARHFNVKTVRTNDEPAETFGYQEFMEIIREKNIHAPAFPEFNKNFEIKGVKVNILYPPEDFLERKKIETWRDLNSNSMVIRLEMGEFSCLFTGDIKARSEAELIRLYSHSLNSRVLIAPHHGSNTSSTTRFLDKVDPEIVIFCAGWNNRFNLPNKEVLKRYEQRNTQILRTDYKGAIMIRTNGGSMRVESFLP